MTKGSGGKVDQKRETLLPRQYHPYPGLSFEDNAPVALAAVSPVVAQATEEGIVSPSGTKKKRPMVRVVAPMALAEGYTFLAKLGDGRAFRVTVPKGGVAEGQSFLVLYPETFVATAAVSPDGSWKDGLCSCFRYGVFHPMLWLACCCSTIAVSQVMTRMRLNWYAVSGTDGEVKQTFKIVTTITVCYYALYCFSMIMTRAFIVCDDEDSISCKFENTIGFVSYAVNQILSFVWIVFTVYLVMETRRVVREKHNIREETCHGCEDCCCALWCTCCSVTQMARHSADYDSYSGICCTPTGLPEDALV